MDHYKDSFQLTLQHWKTRNRLFIFVLLTLTLILFQLTSPNVLEQIANSYIRKQVGPTSSSELLSKAAINQSQTSGYPTPTSNESDLTEAHEAQTDLVDFRFITSLLWFVLAFLLVQYYQRSILVDRQYIYLDQLEQQLKPILGANCVTREGEFYKTDRPKYLNHVGYLYQWLFLLLLALVILAKLVQEWIFFARERSSLDSGVLMAAVIFIVIDTVIGAAIGYYTMLYIQWLKRP